MDNPVECSCYSQQGVPDSLVQDVMLQDYMNWSVEEDQDPVIREVKLLLSKSLTGGNLSPGAKKLLKERKSLRMVGSILTRTRICSGEEQLQLVLPRKYWDVALKYVHDEMGHLGRERSLQYVWTGMHQSVADHITNCGRCIRWKDWNPQRAPLVNTVTSQPMELVCIDFLKLEPSKGALRMFSWSLTISPNMPRHTPHVIKQQRQLLVYCTRTFSFIMDFLGDYIVIKVGILRAR